MQRLPEDRSYKSILKFFTGRAFPKCSESAELAVTTPQGLQVVYEGINPIVDIVAVHGLEGHCEKAWTAGSGIDSVNWLRDLLPHDLPNARILSWGYDADRLIRSCMLAEKVYGHGRNLVSDLCSHRQSTEMKKRPIIFVAHSLGGIVVKSALLNSDSAPRGFPGPRRSIKLSTYGILFMGTPHQVSSGVTLGEILVNMALVFIAADSHLLQHLKSHSQLAQLLMWYERISGDFVTKCMYEEYPTQTVFGKSIMVVPRESAVLLGVANSEPIAMHTDHINMVKFGSKTERGYMTVSGHLQLMARDAGDTISGRWDADDKIQDALSTHSTKSERYDQHGPHSQPDHRIDRALPTNLTEPERYDQHGYCIDGALGRGAFGIVLRVRHRDRSGSLYARKQIAKQDVDVQALRNEVKLIQQASHRHVVKVIEDYVDNEHFFIVMEPVADRNLQQYLQQMISDRTQQPPDWIAFGKKRLQSFGFVRCIVAALKEIHSRGVRHRDIKPENILVQDQNIILTDFGTAFVTQEATAVGFTRTQGTFKYNPPETFIKEGIPSEDYVARTGRPGDVFSLGCVLYEMLEAISINAEFPHVNGCYATHVAQEGFLDEVRQVKENRVLVAKRLEEQCRLPGLLQKTLNLVVDNMMVVSPQERKDASSVLELIGQIYSEYPQLQSGCCAVDV